MNLKKVLTLSFNFPPHFVGGDAISAYNYALSLSKMGIENYVVYDHLGYRLRAKRKNRINEEIQRDFKGKNLVVYQMNSILNTFLNYGLKLSPILYKKIKTLIKEKNIELLHSHNIDALGFSPFIAAKRKGLPTFFTAHGWDLICPRNYNYVRRDGRSCRISYSYLRCTWCYLSQGELRPPRIKSVWKYFLKKIDCIICPSRYMLKTLKKFFPDKRFTHIPNALDSKIFDTLSKEKVVYFKKRFGVEPDDEVILYVGTLSKSKGVEDLIEAFKILKKSCGKNLKLMIVGDENERKNLLKLEKDERIVFTGRLLSSDLACAYRTSSLFVLPSRTPENCPMTIIEAMASGLPVVASRIGGIPELVREDRNGFCFKSSEIDELAEKIEKALEKKEKFGKNGREYFQKNHTLEKLAHSLISEYEKFI
ncbi:MAG: glycosyltransferase family 4 protein [Candidatus Methanofastidiosia archaeon]